MEAKKIWDRPNPMPPGREFEVYHPVDDDVQAIIYHNHPFYEIYFYIQGHNRIIVEGLDLLPSRGDVLIYPPGIMHRNIHQDAQVPYERFYVFARREFLQSISAADFDIPATIAQMTRGGQYYFHVNEQQLDELVAIGDMMIESAEHTEPAEKLMNRYRMGILMVDALTMMTSREIMPQSEYSKGMSRLIQYINLHVTEPLTLDDLADAFFASKFYILREFKRYTGISVHQYMIIRRIMLAQELIGQGVKPRDACARCGFTDYSSFYRSFKARTGLSPEQFRSQNS